MEQPNTLGKRIAMLRKNQGWTQEQLGEKVGVSAQAVSKWENDQACPDITTLPLLAELFGVTTDELLGIKPIEPRVVVLDKEPEEEKKKNMNFHFEMHNDSGKWGTIAFCITAILLATVLILRSTTPLFNRPDVITWNYIWPVLLFGFGLMIVRGSVTLGVTAMALGAYELVWFGWGVPFEIKWYVVLLIFAIAVLLRLILDKLGLLKKKRPAVEVHGDAPNRVCSYSDEGQFIRAEMDFGSNHIEYPYDTLNGVDLETNFGDHRIDLTKVEHFNNCVIKADVNFGNVVILLPDNVQITRSADTAFAAVRVLGSPRPDASETMYLRGDVNFGNLELKYPNA